MTNTLAKTVADCVEEQIAIANKALNSAMTLLKLPEVRAIVVERMALKGDPVDETLHPMLHNIDSLGDFEHVLKGIVGRGDLI